MHTIIILLVVAALAYFLFLKPKSGVTGTYFLRQGAFVYYGPDNTVRTFVRGPDMVFVERMPNSSYLVSGSSIRVKSPLTNETLVGHPELNGKLIVFTKQAGKEGHMKISDKLLAPKQMAELIDTGAIAGVITRDETAALDGASRPLLA